MNRTKIFIGLSIAIFAGAAAFANPNNSKRTTVWYLDGDNICQSIDETICNTGSADCKGTKTADLNKQLFTTSSCQTKLTKTP